MNCHRCGQRHAIYEEWAVCLAASVGFVYEPGLSKRIWDGYSVADLSTPITKDEVLDIHNVPLSAWSESLRALIAAEGRKA